jgi:hypothetical protein
VPCIHTIGYTPNHDYIFLLRINELKFNINQFCSFFGGFNFHFGGSDHSHRRDTPKGADIVMDLDVTLEELYSGEFIEVCHALITKSKKAEAVDVVIVCADMSHVKI